MVGAAAATAIVNLPGQLSASSGDVVATGTSGDGGDAGADQDIAEPIYPRLARASVEGAGKRIERNQIHLRGNAPDPLHQVFGVPVLVIEAVDHDVFPGNPLMSRLLAIVKVPARRQQFGQRIFTIQNLAGSFMTGPAGILPRLKIAAIFYAGFVQSMVSFRFMECWRIDRRKGMECGVECLAPIRGSWGPGLLISRNWRLVLLRSPSSLESLLTLWWAGRGTLLMTNSNGR